MIKIAFIVPYFGKLPQHFPMWLTSCKFNPTVDWYLFTDDLTDYDYPRNVHKTHMTFEHAKLRFQSKFDFKIALENPYKLCDFKPSYGLVFQDYLSQYDFWGFCDIDVIFGNIRHFISDSILSNYDKILCHGHLVLIRNSCKHNNIFKSKINNKVKYKEVFADKKHRGFDEYGSEAFHSICENSDMKLYINNTIFADLDSWKTHFALTHVKRVLLKEEEHLLEKEYSNEDPCNIFSFINGCLKRLYISNKQLYEKDYLYVHMQKRTVSVKLSGKTSDKFMLVPNKFIDFIPACDAETVYRLGRKRFFSSRRWPRRIRVYCRNCVKNWTGI